MIVLIMIEFLLFVIVMIVGYVMMKSQAMKIQKAAVKEISQLKSKSLEELQSFKNQAAAELDAVRKQAAELAQAESKWKALVAEAESKAAMNKIKEMKEIQMKEMAENLIPRF